MLVCLEHRWACQIIPTDVHAAYLVVFQGIWLQLDDCECSPIWEELLTEDPSGKSYVSNAEDNDRIAKAKRAKGLFLFSPVLAEFTWRNFAPLLWPEIFVALQILSWSMSAHQSHVGRTL